MCSDLCANILAPKGKYSRHVHRLPKGLLDCGRGRFKEEKNLVVFSSCAYGFVKLSNEIYIRDLVLLVISKCSDL